jgi:hypothetical protein
MKKRKPEAETFRNPNEMGIVGDVADAEYEHAYAEDAEEAHVGTHVGGDKKEVQHH